MSEAKFTPGWWYARTWNTHEKTTVLVDAPEAFLKVRQIAECDEEDDARLIAAAPDLYTTLQHTTFLLHSACLVLEDEEARKTALEAVERARAVLAKVQGEQA
jgi:hypothetical protein